MGTDFYWGNLSAYVKSYFRSKVDPDPSITTLWVISLTYIGWTVASIGCGYIVGFIGQGRAMILACVLVDAGVILTYFSVQRSMMAVNVSMGALAGFGCGLVFNMGYQHIASFDLKNVGLAMSVIETGMSVGAALLNQLITFYVNPNNLPPDLLVGREKYFSQEELLDKVPSVLLVIGFFNVCCHVTGVILIRVRKGRETDVQYVQKEKCDSNHSSALTDNVNDMEKNELLNLKSPSANGISNGSQSKVKEETHTHTDTPAVPAPVENLSPKQILKCGSFHALWICYTCCDYSFSMLNNFFKTYGQMWIPDDQFLANLATAQLLVAMLFRPLWGAFVDRYGVKLTLMCEHCLTCVLSAFWYFTPMVNPWTYFFWTTIFASCNCGIFATIPVSVLRLYGKDHFPGNFGMVSTFSIVINLTAPSFTHYILHTFGWFYLFFSAACGMALSVIFCVVALPVK